MVQKDYILRMIEQMAAIVAQLRRQIMKGDTTGLEAEARTLANAAGVDLTLARVLDPESILSLLSPSGRPDPMRVWLAAELLYLEGLAVQVGGPDDHAIEMLAKARVLFGALEGGVLPSVIPEASERIAEIDRLLES